MLSHAGWSAPVARAPCSWTLSTAASTASPRLSAREEVLVLFASQAGLPAAEEVAEVLPSLSSFSSAPSDMLVRVEGTLLRLSSPASVLCLVPMNFSEGRQYFMYPSQSTALRPALAAIMRCTLCAKAAPVSPGWAVTGSMNQMSTTMAQEVIILNRCPWKDSCREFQYPSTNTLLYLIAMGFT